MSYVIEKSWNKVEELIYPIFSHTSMEFFLGLIVLKAISSWLRYSEDSWNVCNTSGWCKDLSETFNEIFNFVLLGFALALYFSLTYRAVKSVSSLRPMTFMPVVALALLPRIVIYFWNLVGLCVQEPSDYSGLIPSLAKFLECEAYSDVSAFNAINDTTLVFASLAGLAAGVR